MAYTINLDIFRVTAGHVTENAAGGYGETFAIRFSVPQKNLVLEKIIDLIRQYCQQLLGCHVMTVMHVNAGFLIVLQYMLYLFFYNLHFSITTLPVVPVRLRN